MSDSTNLTLLLVMLFIAVGTVFVVMSIQQSDVDENRTDKYTSVCIDNVSYWERVSGYKGFLAVRYDTNGNMSPVSNFIVYSSSIV